MPRRRPIAILATVAALAAVLCGCVAPSPATRDEVHVPADAATLEAAMGLVSPGGVIEIAAGRYEEQLVVDKADVTIRGADRNGTIIDGGGIRPYGIVAIADGVRIENLTVTGALCFVEADWPLIGGAFSTRGVQVMWPKQLAKTLVDVHAGPVDVQAMARHLASRLPSA